MPIPSSTVGCADAVGRDSTATMTILLPSWRAGWLAGWLAGRLAGGLAGWHSVACKRYRAVALAVEGDLSWWHAGSLIATADASDVVAGAHSLHCPTVDPEGWQKRSWKTRAWAQLTPATNALGCAWTQSTSTIGRRRRQGSVVQQAQIPAGRLRPGLGSGRGTPGVTGGATVVWSLRDAPMDVAALSQR